MDQQTRDLALFNLAIDSKLRGCDVVAVKVDDVASNGYAIDRATVRQKKTGRPFVLSLQKQPGWPLTTTSEPPAENPVNFCSAAGGLVRV